MKTMEEELLKIKNRKDFDQELMTNFQETLKNKTFKKLIDKLKMPYEVLMKDTSLLEDASKEYEHCLNCKGLIQCQNKVIGHAYLPEKKAKKLRFGYKACRYQEKYLKENAYQENVQYLYQPKMIQEASMQEVYIKDKNRLETIKWLNDFINKNDLPKKGLYLYGSFGTGKTYLIAAMFNELAKKKIKSAIVFWPEYLTSLKGNFGTEDYVKKINKLKHVPLLLIDDIGAENSTAWSRDEVLSPILQYRMQEEKTTFFTSNLDKKALEEHLSISKEGTEVIKARRIMERINQLTEEMTLVSKNLRK